MDNTKKSLDNSFKLIREIVPSCLSSPMAQSAIGLVQDTLHLKKDISERSLVELYDLNHKYERLQNLYYSMYIESFSDSSFDKNACTFIRLYNNFKGVCRLLVRIKNLIILEKNLKVNLNLQVNEKVQMLGTEEIKVLLTYRDIKRFLDKNNLYSIIDSNYDII